LPAAVAVLWAVLVAPEDRRWRFRMRRLILGPLILGACARAAPVSSESLAT
jgi:hypothetical protein